MLNISDKDLDRLSREAAEYYEPEDSALSWNKLEQRLGSEITDKPPASLPFYRRGPIIMGSLVLLLAGISYFLFKSIHVSNNSTQKQIVSNLTQHPQGSDKQSGAAKASQSVTHNQSPNQADQNSTNPQPKNDNSGNASGSVSGSVKEHEIAANKSTSASRNSNAEDAAITNKNNGSNKKNIKNNKYAAGAAGAGLIAGKSRNSVNKNNGNNIKSIQENNLVQSKENSNESISASQNKNIAGDNTDKSLEYAMLPGLQSYNNVYPAISDSSLRKFTIQNKDNSSAQKNQQSLHINRALKIGIMYAPDYTNVPSGPSNGTSNNIGITIGYEFVDRWSVNTGLIYTKKNYGANGDDFHAQYTGGGWGYGSQLDYVKGNCDMWEIPLSLRYDFVSTKKNSFFANAGLSSYLMRKEEYSYFGHSSWNASTFYWSKGPYSYTNRNLYLLSIASVSVGMEHQFGKGFSLQVEPFMKIPLIGVGLGSLQMNSYGVSFSLRYAPVLSKTRH